MAERIKEAGDNNDRCRSKCAPPGVAARASQTNSCAVLALDMSAISILMGFCEIPGWFALAGVPILYAFAYYGIHLLSEREEMVTLLDMNPFVDRRRFAILLVAASFALNSLTFYLFLTVSSLGTGKVDNKNPRSKYPIGEDSLRGRLYAAHQNQLENFPPFAGAVLASLVTNACTEDVLILACIHIMCRILYVIMYAASLPAFRTFVWVTSNVATGMIFLRALAS